MDVTAAQLADAIEDLRGYIQPSFMNPGLVRGDVVGGLVRLAFHDAAEYLSGAGDNFRADGCVDLTKGDNGGLAAVIDGVQPYYLAHCSVFSRADFWYLAAVVSLNLAEPSGTYDVPFNFGREDASSCVYTGGRLPDAEGGFGEVRRVFIDNMGLTMTESIALLGAHTLGRTETANSGYNGPWVTATNRFDNQFFV